MVIISLRVNQRQSLVAGWGGNWLRRLLWLAVNPPPQVAGHQIDRHGCQHQNYTEPDAPVTMGASPIRRMAMMKFFAIGIFKPVVLVL
jgi:hypothetical protein